jgi:surface antigen
MSLKVRNARSGLAGATLLSVALVLGGCQNMSNRDIGTGIGVVAGGIAGSFFGKGAGKFVAVALGSAIGGFIGNQIGASLDEQQKTAIMNTGVRTLDSAADGQAIVWSDGKAQANVTAGNTRQEQKKVVVVRNRDVAPPRALELVGSDYRVKSSAPVYLAANASAGRATTLKAGDTVHVVGRVEGTKYALVSRNRKSIGYVEMAKLTAVPAVTASARQPSTGAASKMDSAATPAPAPIRAAIDLDATPDATATAAAAQGVDLDAEGAIADTIVASTTCRDLTTQVTVDGQSETTTSKACKAADGAWELL